MALHRQLCVAAAGDEQAALRHASEQERDVREGVAQRRGVEQLVLGAQAGLTTIVICSWGLCRGRGGSRP